MKADIVVCLAFNYNHRVAKRGSDDPGTDMSNHLKINYLEIPAHDLEAVKSFFTQVFDWQFTDYGPDYCAFADSAGIDGGFYRSSQTSTVDQGSVLIVFYSEDLSATQDLIVSAGGKINLQMFSFPGGQRFHFLDPCGNEFAVWSE